MTVKTNILSLPHEKAREFFLRESSFCSIDLPEYFSFSDILSFASKRPLDSIKTIGARKYDNTNYTLVCNKDGKYAWRPLQIINPIVYLKLVNLITQQDNWNMLIHRFHDFQSDPKILCTSIPVYQELDKTTKAKQILNWWSDFEQQSIQLSLEYSYIIMTDITDCYGSLYTHSIAWAIHDKQHAKLLKNDHCILGNCIDDFIEDMKYGQTNGISQGSILMDFIAEIVLGYIDLLLSIKLKDNKITNYKILRYRDDYRVFVNDSSTGENILKELTIILYDFGMRLNSSKTIISSNIVLSSIKEDKRAWLAIASSFDKLNIQKKLLLIFEHAMKYPNSGSLLQPLNEIYKELPNSMMDLDSILAIVIEIAYRNPRTYQICMAIIAKLIKKYPVNIKQGITEKILRKFNSLPNTEYLNIWLQRILYPIGIGLPYIGLLTNIVEGKTNLPWCFDWITDTGLCNKLKQQTIINRSILNSISTTIPENEIDIFIKRDTDYP